MLSKEKQALFKMQSEVVSALAHPLRIAIVDFLKDGEQCVCDIAEHIGSERSNVSRHLSVMVRADLLESRKEGLNVMYKLRAPCIVDFLVCASECLKKNIKESEKLLKVL